MCGWLACLKQKSPEPRVANLEKMSFDRDPAFGCTSLVCNHTAELLPECSSALPIQADSQPSPGRASITHLKFARDCLSIFSKPQA